MCTVCVAFSLNNDGETHIKTSANIPQIPNFESSSLKQLSTKGTTPIKIIHNNVFKLLLKYASVEVSTFSAFFLGIGIFPELAYAHIFFNFITRNGVTAINLQQDHRLQFYYFFLSVFNTRFLIHFSLNVFVLQD